MTLLQMGVLLFFLYILLLLSLSHMLLAHHLAFVCRQMLHVTARDLSLFFILQLLRFACLDV